MLLLFRKAAGWQSRGAQIVARMGVGNWLTKGQEAKQLTGREIAAGSAGSGRGGRARLTAGRRQPASLTRRPLPGLSPLLITCIAASNWGSKRCDTRLQLWDSGAIEKVAEHGGSGSKVCSGAGPGIRTREHFPPQSRGRQSESPSRSRQPRRKSNATKLEWRHATQPAPRPVSGASLAESAWPHSRHVECGQGRGDGASPTATVGVNAPGGNADIPPPCWMWAQRNSGPSPPGLAPPLLPADPAEVKKVLVYWK